MSTNRPTCTLGLGGTDLSAWRDAQLSAEEMRRIGAHVPTCVACGRTLARFEAVAVALRRQRELEPGDRVWGGILTRAAGRRGGSGGRSGGGSGPNGNWRGIGALVAVAAVLALFVLLLGPWRLAHQVAPTPTTTAQVSPTASPTIKGSNYTPVPQTTTPPFTPPTPNEPLTTWAASAKVATVNTQIDATHVLIAESISPDGQTLLGALETSNGAGHGPTDQPAMMSIATRHVTVLSGIPSQIGGFGPSGCCQDDGHFLVAVISTAPGATCGICNNAVYSYDLTTGVGRQVPNDKMLGNETTILSSGQVAMQDANDQIAVSNLTTGKVVQITPPASSTNQSQVRLLAFSAPYVFYSVTPPSTPQTPTPAATIHVRDVSTGQDVVLSQVHQFQTSNSSISLEMIGATLSIAVSTSSPTGGRETIALYTLPNFTPSDTATPARMTTPNAECGLPEQSVERLLSCYDDPTGTFFYYDRDQGRYLLPSAQPQSYAPSQTISGHYLLDIEPAGQSTGAASPPEAVMVYDLSRVPTTAS